MTTVSPIPSSGPPAARSTAGLRFRRGVRESIPFVLDWSQLDRGAFIRLDCNESTQPLSPHVADAIAEHVHSRGVHTYPDPHELTAAIAAYCGVDERCVLATSGSDQAIGLCLRAFLGPGDTMLVARPEFVAFGHTAALIEAEVRGVLYPNDLTFPYDAFRSALTERPDLIVIVNPNNPTGTSVDVGFIEEVAQAWPDVPVLVDEAYFEFTGATVIPLVASLPNLIVLRTFSKAFAMAGLRLGYVVAEAAVITQLAKLRNPFDVNAIAVLAGLVQLAHLDEMRSHVGQLMTVIKPMVVGFFERHDIPVWPGAANFVLVRPDDCEEVVGALHDAGVLVRRLGGPPLAGMFRMSLGTGDEMAHTIEVYQGLLSTRRSTREKKETT